MSSTVTNETSKVKKKQVTSKKTTSILRGEGLELKTKLMDVYDLVCLKPCLSGPPSSMDYYLDCGGYFSAALMLQLLKT